MISEQLLHQVLLFLRSARSRLTEADRSHANIETVRGARGDACTMLQTIERDGLRRYLECSLLIIPQLSCMLPATSRSLPARLASNLALSCSAVGMEHKLQGVSVVDAELSLLRALSRAVALVADACSNEASELMAFLTTSPRLAFAPTLTCMHGDGHMPTLGLVAAVASWALDFIVALDDAYALCATIAQQQGTGAISVSALRATIIGLLDELPQALRKTLVSVRPHGVAGMQELLGTAAVVMSTVSDFMLECAVVAIGLLEHSLLILDHTLDSELAAAHKVHLTRDKLPVIGVDDAGSTLLDLLGRVQVSFPALLADASMDLSRVLSTKLIARCHNQPCNVFVDRTHVESFANVVL